MGCCEPVLAPIENYYTKYQIDKMIASAVTSGCCITPEEVDEKIEEAISGITVSGVTEEELNNAIASAKTEIEAEIPTVPTKVSAFENDVPYLTEHQSLSGYATEQWVLDKNYITGVDLSDYALKSEIPTVPTSNTAFTNDAGYLTEHQSLSGYATEQWVSSFTYDKATIDEKVAEGGTFDPTQYYNKTATNALLDEKLDVTAYTPTDLSNYYNKQEVNNIVESAKTEVESEIPTVPTSNTAFTNDAGYLTEHQSLSGYATEQWVLDKNYITGVDLSNYATKDEIPTVPTKVSAFENDVPYLTEHQSLSGYVTDAEMSAYTYDKQTIDDKIAQGGTFDPSQYYNTAQTNNLIESAVTRVEGEIPSLSGYATEQWVLDKNYITGVDLSNYATKAEIPTVPTSNTAFTNDAGYLTEHQSLSAYSTTDEVNSAITQATSGKANSSDVYLKGETSGATEIQNALNAKADPYSAGTGISIVDNVISATGGGASYSAGRGIDITNNIISFDISISGGSGDLSVAENNDTIASGYWSHAEGAGSSATSYASHAEGKYTLAEGDSSHAEGSNTVTKNFTEHASGRYNVSSSASTTFGDSGNTLFSVGNGTSAFDRHNAFEIRQNGDIYFNNGTSDVKLQDELSSKASTTYVQNNYLLKSKIWCGTQNEYDSIQNKDSETLYLIHE